MTLLNEPDSKDLLRQTGINVNRTVLAASREEAVALSREIGFPVALKIVSPDITHKSDDGGVKLGLETAVQVGQAYDDILAAAGRNHPEARLDGVAVQEMAPPGVEVIIGVSRDDQFGPVLMFGLGGILVELLRDVSFRIIPVTRRDAAEMIRDIKGYALLTGFRGQEPVNIAALEEMLLKVSALVEKRPDIRELDLNPVFADGNGAMAVDARILLDTDA